MGEVEQWRAGEHDEDGHAEAIQAGAVAWIDSRNEKAETRARAQASRANLLWARVLKASATKVAGRSASPPRVSAGAGGGGRLRS